MIHVDRAPCMGPHRPTLSTKWRPRGLLADHVERPTIDRRVD